MILCGVVWEKSKEFEKRAKMSEKTTIEGNTAGSKRRADEDPEDSPLRKSYKDDFPSVTSFLNARLPIGANWSMFKKQAGTLAKPNDTTASNSPSSESSESPKYTRILNSPSKKVADQIAEKVSRPPPSLSTSVRGRGGGASTMNMRGRGAAAPTSIRGRGGGAANSRGGSSCFNNVRKSLPVEIIIVWHRYIQMFTYFYMILIRLKWIWKPPITMNMIPKNTEQKRVELNK